MNTEMIIFSFPVDREIVEFKMGMGPGKLPSDDPDLSTCYGTGAQVSSWGADIDMRRPLEC